MMKVKSHTEKVIYGLHKLLGVNLDSLYIYAEHNDIINILDHPMSINANDEIIERIRMLKSFMNSYDYLRDFEDGKEICFNNSTVLGKYFLAHLAFSKEKESFLVVFMNARNQIISCEKAFEGTVDSCYIHPREIIKRALQLDCSAIAIAHNHPSGSLKPSQEDELLTIRLKETFSMVGVRLIDHIIVGNNQFISFKDIGMLSDEYGVSIGVNERDKASYIEIGNSDYESIEEQEDMELER